MYSDFESESDKMLRTGLRNTNRLMLIAGVQAVLHIVLYGLLIWGMVRYLDIF